VKREYFNKIWKMLEKPELEEVKYIYIDAGVRIAWHGNLNQYVYWIEYYDKMLNLWIEPEMGQDEIEELNDTLMSHLVISEINRQDRIQAQKNKK